MDKFAIYNPDNTITRHVSKEVDTYRGYHIIRKWQINEKDEDVPFTTMYYATNREIYIASPNLPDLKMKINKIFTLMANAR